jgi:hypothetical protein
MPNEAGSGLKGTFMISPGQFYRTVCTDQFCDTDTKELSEIDRTLLEFHLSTLTTSSQEIDFERFARRLCEKEICPNLLPTTGPTGGGDSKADAETFPVADSLTLRWYGGIAREASEERWAFAFSAKADWLAKVRSDIQNIAGTARGYARAFFVTNQSVPARQRAKTEDELREKYGIDVRILDRTWLLERTFAKWHQYIAIEELKITGIARQTALPGRVVGAHIAALEKLEARIAEAVEKKRFDLPLIDDALDAADLYRRLERPRTEVEGSYVRADRLATQYGTRRQQVEAAYQWAWTLFLWYEDFVTFKSKYVIVEERARESDNVYDLERLYNLCTLMRNPTFLDDEQTANWVGERTTTLQESLSRLSRDEERPSTALQARLLLLKGDLMCRLKEGNDPSAALDGLRFALETAEGLVGFQIKPLTKTILLIGRCIGDSEAYNRLLEKLIDVEARRESQVRAAILLLERGDQLMDQRKYTKAISVVGQAHTRLYKHETRRDILHALFLCGGAYERIGLLWAARGAYLSGAGIGANNYRSFGWATREFFACVNRLKWVEAKLGRLPHILWWHEADIAMRSIGRQAASEHEETAFDLVIARLILRVPPDAHSLLSSLPASLDDLGLSVSAGAALFLLGYPERLEEVVDEEETPDELANRIWRGPMDIPVLAQPELCDGAQISLTTKILGCTINAQCSEVAPCVEIAEAIFSSLECMLSTSAIERAVGIEPEATMNVEIGELPSGFLSVDIQEHLGRPHFGVRCKAVNPYELAPEELEKLRNEIFLASLKVFPHLVLFHNLEQDLERLFQDERVVERASLFAITTGAIRNMLGEAPKFRMQDWLSNEVSYKIVRPEPWHPNTVSSGDDTPHAQSSLRVGHSETPTHLIDLTQVSHEEIEILSHIRIKLWDRAGWSDVMFMWSPDPDTPPILGLIFKERDAGTDIFKSWQAEIGDTDEHRFLRVSIVRGISREHPHAYRVLIGPGNWDKPQPSNRLLMVAQRILHMDATTPTNLNNFLKACKVHRRFLLAPAFSSLSGPAPLLENAIGIYELVVRNAWEIGVIDPDATGIFADDDVIIPEGVISPPNSRG